MTLRATLLTLLLSLSACVAPHNLVVTSVPSGADVTLRTATGRDSSMGTTPVRTRHTLRGPMTLIVSRAGYKTYVEEIVLEPKSELQRYIELELEHE